MRQRNLDLSRDFTPKEAKALMDKGVWMEGGGMIWRNQPGGACGEYLAYGDYPGNIRTTGRLDPTVADVSDSWRVAKENFLD